MAELNTRINLSITVISPTSEHTMSFPNLQLGTIYQQALQLAHIYVQQDEEQNAHHSSMRETQYMGLTHLRNKIIAPEHPRIEFLRTHSIDRNTTLIYTMYQTPSDSVHTPPVSFSQEDSDSEDECYMYDDDDDDENEDSESAIISIASSNTMEEEDPCPPLRITG